MNRKNQVGIEDLAKGTGTMVATVRYYEQNGLLPVKRSGQKRGSAVQKLTTLINRTKRNANFRVSLARYVGLVNTTDRILC